jgi:DNA-binding Lrp family transcriptional regulator
MVKAKILDITQYATIKRDIMNVPIPEKPEDRMEMISQVFTSPKHLIVFRALTRTDSWASVAQIVKKTKVSKRTVYRIIKDFRRAKILDAKTVSRRRMYRLAEGIRWIGTLIEEPKVQLSIKDLPGRDHVSDFLSQDKLARDIVESLLQASGPLTLRQISTEAGAWAIEVKSRLNQLIDEGLVLKRDLGYMPNRKTASEIIKEVNT